MLAALVSYSRVSTKYMIAAGDPSFCLSALLNLSLFYVPSCDWACRFSLHSIRSSFYPTWCVLLDRRKAHLVCNRYRVFKVVGRRNEVKVVPQIVRAPPATSVGMEIPLSDEIRMHRNNHFLYRMQLGKLYLHWHRLVHIDVRRRPH